MTMAILQFESAPGKTRRLKVKPRQSVLIGASHSADIKLCDADGVAPQHCEVKFDGRTFAIQNLASKRRKLYVNGTAVETASLSDGDRIAIGNNELTVIMTADRPDVKPSPEPAANNSLATAGVAGAVGTSAIVEASNAPTPVTPAPATKTPPAEPEATAVTAKMATQPTDSEPVEQEPVYEMCDSGVQTFEIDSFTQWLHPTLQERPDTWRYALLVNHKLGGMKEPAPKVANLIEDETPDVTDENDLYLLTDDSLAKLLKQFAKYAAVGAATLLIGKVPPPEPEPNSPDQDDDQESTAGQTSLPTEPETPTPDPLEGVCHSLAMWLLSPSTAKFSLTNGTESLIEKVFANIDILVVPDTNGQRDLVLFHDPSVTDWDSFLATLREEA